MIKLSSVLADKLPSKTFCELTGVFNFYDSACMQ